MSPRRLIVLFAAAVVAVAALLGGAAGARSRPAQGRGDCGDFGGRIHGTSTCVRIDLGTGRVTPTDWRVNGNDQAACGMTSTVAGHQLAIRCANVAPRSSSSKRIRISASIDGKPAVAVDDHEGYWDFMMIWLLGRERAVDLTIDYGVYD